jgi:hypothetical protein
VFLASPQKSRAICIHEQVEKSGVQELQNETAASGLWMVINRLHAMKNHAGAGRNLLWSKCQSQRDGVGADNRMKAALEIACYSP